MKNERIKISVVIPCYNEEKILIKTIKSLKFFFKKYDCLFDYELIFVDDGSNDDTLSILKEMDGIKYESYENNQGKGEAVKIGLIKTKYNNIMLLDTDLSVRPNELLSIKNLNNENSFIIKGQRIQVKSQPIYRLIAGWGFRFLTDTILNLNIKDTQCPFWIFHNINKRLFKGVKTKGFAFDCEILFKAKQIHYQIIKKDVDYFNNSDSAVRLKHYFLMLYELIKIRFL